MHDFNTLLMACFRVYSFSSNNTNWLKIPSSEKINKIVVRACGECVLVFSIRLGTGMKSIEKGIIMFNEMLHSFS